MTAPRFVTLCIVFISLVVTLAARPQIARDKLTPSKGSKKYKVCWDYDDEQILNFDIRNNVVPFSINVKNGTKPTKWYYRLFQMESLSTEEKSRSHSEMTVPKFSASELTSTTTGATESVSVTDTPESVSVVTTERGSTVESSTDSESEELSREEFRSANASGGDQPYINESTEWEGVETDDSTTVEYQTNSTLMALTTKYSPSEFTETSSQTTHLYRNLFRMTSLVESNPSQLTTDHPFIESSTLSTTQSSSAQTTAWEATTLDQINAKILTPRVPTTQKSLPEEITTLPPAASTIEPPLSHDNDIQKQLADDSSNLLVTNPVETSWTTIGPTRAPLLSSTFTTEGTTASKITITPTTEAPKRGWITPSKVIVPVFLPAVNFTFYIPVRRDFTISFPDRRLFYSKNRS